MTAALLTLRRRRWSLGGRPGGCRGHPVGPVGMRVVGIRAGPHNRGASTSAHMPRGRCAPRRSAYSPRGAYSARICPSIANADRFGRFIPSASEPRPPRRMATPAKTTYREGRTLNQSPCRRRTSSNSSVNIVHMSSFHEV
jgi:hypothetical protein